MHYHGYKIHQISLYGSDQSQQSLFIIAYWIPIGYTYTFNRKVSCAEQHDHHGVVVVLLGRLTVL